MFSNLMTAFLVILPVAISTSLIAGVRTRAMIDTDQIEMMSFAEARKKEAMELGILALCFGVIATLAYLLMAQSFPSATRGIFMIAGFGLALLLSVAAIFVRPQAGLGGVPEVIAMNVIWGTGYGWLLPFVLRHFGQGLI